MESEKTSDGISTELRITVFLNTDQAEESDAILSELIAAAKRLAGRVHHLSIMNDYREGELPF